MSEKDNIGMSLAKARVYLGVGKTKLYDLLAENCFPNAYKIGGSTLIPLFDLMEYRQEMQFGGKE